MAGRALSTAWHRNQFKAVFNYFTYELPDSSAPYGEIRLIKGAFLFIFVPKHSFSDTTCANKFDNTRIGHCEVKDSLSPLSILLLLCPLYCYCPAGTDQHWIATCGTLSWGLMGRCKELADWDACKRLAFWLALDASLPYIGRLGCSR